MSGAGFTKGVEQLQTIQSMYRNLSPSGIQQKLSNAIATSSKIEKRDGSNINEAMDKTISHIAENYK